jgi:hypothetical protein
MWSEVSANGAGWITPLSDIKAWKENISRAIDIDQEQFTLMSQNARQFAVDWLRSPDLETATEKVLIEVFGD